MLSVALLGGCIAQRTVPPPPLPAPTGNMPLVGLWLAEFSVHGVGAHDDTRDTTALGQRLLNYIGSTGAVATDDVTRRTLVPVVLDVSIDFDQTTRRTYVLDAANLVLFPLLAGLLVPRWGHVDAALHATLRAPDGTVRARYERTTQVPFANVLWSWYARGYIEAAYERAYEELFVSLAAAIGDDAARLAYEPTLTALAGPVEPVHIQADVDWAAIYVPQEPPPETRLGAALAALGGIEASGFAGLATVSSGIETDDGSGERPVAAGAATQLGYRVALYGAPRTTGWFVMPALGFLDQRISIHDFVQDLPETNVAGTHEIDALCTWVESGQRFDCQAPNVYDLRLRTGYAGARGGYDLVLGSPRVRFFCAGSLALNFAEYRSLVTHIGNYRDRERGWSFLSSGALGGTLGVVWPQAHFATRVIFEREIYRRFDYARPHEFRGPAVYDTELHRYVRPRTWVSDADLQSWTLEWTVAYVY
ncbi:MAG: hypothetical protein AAB426_12000 [Myxococcota bacterium]